MTKVNSTPAGAVLVAIDMSKHRQEVLIERLREAGDLRWFLCFRRVRNRRSGCPRPCRGRPEPATAFGSNSAKGAGPRRWAS